MSGIVKKILLGFSLLCLIVLGVFCVQLYALNRDRGDGVEAGMQSSESPSDENGTGSGADKQVTDTGPPPSASPSGNNGVSGDAGLPSKPAAPPTGKRYELPMPGALTLVLYADEGLFEHTMLELSDLFTYTGDGTASLAIDFAFFSEGVEKFAESYLDGYAGSGGTSVGAKAAIRGSSLNGVFVSASKDGEIYEAWIHNFEGEEISDMGVVFVLHYRDNAQKSALYGVLDTLEIVAGQSG